MQGGRAAGEQAQFLRGVTAGNAVEAGGVHQAKEGMQVNHAIRVGGERGHVRGQQ